VGLPPSPVEFSSHRHFYKFSHSWLLGMCHCSCLLWPGLFIYSSRRDSLPLFGAQGTLPSLLCVFIVVIAYYSVSLFSLGGVRSVQGAMLIWPRVVCGGIAYCLAHLVVHVFPSHLHGAIFWRLRGPSGGSGALLVSPLNVMWRCFVQAGGVDGSKFCLFLVVLPEKWISSIFPRFYFSRHAFCFLPLAAILESLFFSDF
jgi:hypothetical protein